MLYSLGTIVLKSIAWLAISHFPTLIFLIILPSPKSNKSVLLRLFRILFKLPKPTEDSKNASAGLHNLQYAHNWPKSCRFNWVFFASIKAIDAWFPLIIIPKTSIWISKPTVSGYWSIIPHSSKNKSKVLAWESRVIILAPLYLSSSFA